MSKPPRARLGDNAGTVTAERPFRLNVVPLKGTPYQVPIEGELLIGRDDGCDLRLDHPTVSANHALVTQKGTSVAVKDLASTNGTMIGGKPIKGERWLRDKAVFEVGAFQLELVAPETAASTETSPLPKQVVKLDDRDRGVIDALLKDWADPALHVRAVQGAEAMAGLLHCSRQEVNRRVSRLETKLNLRRGERGEARYRRLAEELLRRGLGPDQG
jgi:pSer/pThr/pTyr-binding forkhead associated (FHA) protein